MSFFSLFIFLCSAFAERPVVFQDPGMDEIEYEAQMAAHGHYVYPIEAYVQSRPEVGTKTELISQYAESQLAFVSGDLERAQKLLGEIVESRTADDWTLTERRILVHASLRLAQLAKDEKTQRQYLETSLSIDPELKPDSSLFPPPLLVQRDSLRKSAPLAPVAQWLKAGGWKAVLVNGLRCDSDRCPHFLKAAHLARLTWLSNSHQPVTTVAALDDSLAVPPLGAAMTAETCSAFSGRPCRSAAKPATSTPRAIDLNPPRPAPESEIKMFTNVKSSKSVLKSPWLWAGVGVVAAVIIASQNRGSKDREPSTTYGY